MPENFVDFKTVKQLVTMQWLLDHYRVQLRKVNQHSLRGKCPLPTHQSEKSSESFSADTDRSIWACQSSSCAAARHGKKGGNVLDFVALMESCSIRDAALKIQNWFSTASATREEKVEQRKITPEEKLVAKEQASGIEVMNKPLSFTLKDVDPAHQYLRDRGIDENTAREFGVGFFPGRGTMLGRVVIPIHNERGELVAYAGRSIDGTDPKYKLPSGFVKSAVLFNFHRVDSDRVIIVEGFFDCLKVWQSGSQNVVALMGSSLSDAQYKLLARFKSVVLFLDGDEAGKGGAAKIADQLVRCHFVRVVEVNDGLQPDQLSAEELRSLLSL